MRVLLSIFSAVTLVFGCFVLSDAGDIKDRFTDARANAAKNDAKLNATIDLENLEPKNMFLTLEFAGIFILVLALAGFWSAGTKRKNVVVFYMCYLIITFTMLLYCIVYTFEFGDRLEDFVNVFNIALDGVFNDLVQKMGAMFVVCLLLVLLKFAVSVGLLGCTSAIAALVMVFNMATGVVGFVFMALASFLLLDSQSAQWSAVILVVAGAFTTCVSLLGFRVAEMVLAKARRKRELIVHGANAHAPEGDAVGRKKCCCFNCCCLVSQVWASVYLATMAFGVIVLVINAGLCYVYSGDIKIYIGDKTHISADFLLEEYFFRIATGSILLMIIIMFNFASSLYLFYLSFEHAPDSSSQVLEMSSLLQRRGGARDGVAAVTTIDGDEAKEIDALPPAPPAAVAPEEAEAKSNENDMKFIGEVLELLEESKVKEAATRARQAQVLFASDENEPYSKYAAAMSDAIGACYTTNKAGKVVPEYQRLEQVLDVLSRHHMTNPSSTAALKLRHRELESISAAAE